MKNNYLWLLIIVNIVIKNPATAQMSHTLDSLKNIVSHSRQDTSYVLAQNAYVWSLLQKSDFHQADSILTQAEQLSQRLHYSYGLYRTYYSRGLGLYYQDKAKQALPFAAKALQLANQHHMDPKDRQIALSLMGVLYFGLQKYDVSLRYYLAAVRLTERYQLTYRVTPAFIGVGNVLKVMGKTEQSLNYYRQALTVAQQEPEARMLVLAQAHMGNALSALGRPHFVEALQHYEQALPVAERCGARGPLSDVLTNIGQMHFELGHYAKAMQFLKRSERVCTEDGLTDQHGAVCYSLGQTYQALYKLDVAQSYYEQSFQLARQIGDADEMRTRAQKLAQFYALTAQYKQAYDYQQQTTRLNDSLFNSQSARHVQELTTQYQTEQKEQQIRLMREKAKRSSLETSALISGGVLLLLLSVAISAWLLNRSRLHRLREAQHIRTQIAHDLHDEVGSTLSSISLLSSHTDMLLTQNRAETAQKMVQKIYADARQILEAMDEIIWTINPGNDSLQRIALRLQEYAQPLMESKNIQFSFRIDTNLEEVPISMDVRRGLYLIGKEAINNLVKYSQATQATLRFDRQHDRLRVIIEDNGRGFTPDQSGERTGQTSMKQRAEAIGGTLAIETGPGKGTRLQLLVNQ